MRSGGLRSVAAALLVTVLAALPAFLFGGLGTLVRAELGFGVEGIGIGVAVYFAVSSLASVPGGRLGERIGARPTMLGGVLAGGAALLWMGLATSPLQLGLALALGGVSNAVVQPAANLLLTQYVPVARRGLAFGVKQSAIPAALLLGGIAVASAGAVLGWRGSFLAAASLALVIAPLVPSGPLRPAAPEGGGRTPPQRVTATLALLAAAAGCATAAANSMASYLVEYGVDLGTGQARAGLALAGGSALGIAMRLLMGWQADRRGGGHQLRLVSVLMGASALGYLVLALAGGTWVLLLGTAIAFVTGWGWNALFIYSVVALHPHAPAGSTGVTQGGGFAGSVVGPPAFGYVAGAVGFRWAWLGAVLCGLAAAGFVSAARQRIAATALEQGGVPT